VTDRSSRRRFVWEDINAFSRFDGINVVASEDQPGGKIDYRLGGLIEYLGTAPQMYVLISPTPQTGLLFGQKL
jgi:hypothetical protein